MIDEAEIAAIATEMKALQRRLDAALGIPPADVAPVPLPSIQAPIAPRRAPTIDTNTARKILGVEFSSVYKLARNGKIIGWQSESGVWQYDRASVEDYAARRRPRRVA